MLDDLDDLASIKGVGEKLKEKLYSLDIKSVSDLMNIDRQTLINGGIGKNRVNKLMNEIRARQLGDFITADKLLELRMKLPKISTGVKSLDNILGGGIETGDLTGTTGEYRTGKTQIGFQLAVMAQVPVDQGGLKREEDIHVIYIDTENSFRPERIVSIVKFQEFGKPKDFLKRIHVAEPKTSADQRFFVESINDRFSDLNIGLIIVDSLTGKFREEYIGRATLAERQQLIGQHIAELQRLADRAIAIYVTNQVSTKPDVLFGDPTMPIGGNIVAHRIQTQLFLRYYKGGKRKVEIRDSPLLPPSEAFIRITKNGVEDIIE